MTLVVLTTPDFVKRVARSRTLLDVLNSVMVRNDAQRALLLNDGSAPPGTYASRNAADTISVVDRRRVPPSDVVVSADRPPPATSSSTYTPIGTADVGDGVGVCPADAVVDGDGVVAVPYVDVGLAVTLCDRQRVRELVTVTLIALDGDAVLDLTLESEAVAQLLLDGDTDDDALGFDETLGLGEELGLEDVECESVPYADSEELDEALGLPEVEPRSVTAGDDDTFATVRETVAVAKGDIEAVVERHCVSEAVNDTCALREVVPVLVAVAAKDRESEDLADSVAVLRIDRVGVEYTVRVAI